MNLEEYNDFETMELKHDVLNGIYTYGFEKPSIVQSKGIVPIRSGKDCIIQAQSGTGKTVTYIVGILEQLDIKLKELQFVVIVPTRELVKQVYDVLHHISYHVRSNNMYMMGGHRITNDIRTYKHIRPQIVVTTPGRFYDLMMRKVIDTKNLKTVILDEADELLSRNFKDTIYEIFVETENKDFQVCLLSATLPDEVTELSKKFLRDPIKILVKKEDLTLEGIRQYVVYYDKSQNRTSSPKLSLLIAILENIQFSQLILYTNNKPTCDKVCRVLRKNGFELSAIHGDMSQYERDNVIKEFRNGITRILVTTDLLARGIDIQQVSVVINYDMPYDNELYLHRIGRSGRFGRKGIAINFVYYEDTYIIKDLNAYYSTMICTLPDDLNI